MTQQQQTAEKSQAAPRQQLIVLGMHRSGTSALTGVLHAMGAYVGEEAELTGRSKENPLGYFERQDARKICDSLLYANDADWWKITPLLKGNIPADSEDSAIKGLLQTLDTHGTWALKEPRLCLLLPAFAARLSDPVAIFMYRNPLEVARSLQKRNGFSIAAGLALWEAYNLKALAHSIAMPQVFVDYHSLVSKPKPTIKHLHKELTALGVPGLDWQAAEDAVEPKLHREQADEAELNDTLSPSQLRLWQALKSGKVDGLSLNPSKRCVDVLKDFSETEGEIYHLKSEIEKREIRLANAREKWWEDETALLQLLQQERERNGELIRSLQYHQTQLDNIRQSTIWRASEPLRKLGIKAPWLGHSLRFGLRFVASIARRFRLRHKLRLLKQAHQARHYQNALSHFRRNWHQVGEDKRAISHNLALLGFLRRAEQSDIRALPDAPAIQRSYPEWDKERETAFLADIEALYQKEPDIYDTVSVSIIMPSWNRGDRIGESIDSVLAQTHRNWELIITDDGSEDNTESVVSEYVKRDKRIYYFKQSRAGVSAARNRGIEAANGEYLFYLDSDNNWLPEYLRRMVVFLKAARLDAGYAGIEAVNDEGETEFFRGDGFHWETCYHSNYVDLNCFAHHRRLIDGGERFDTSMKRLVDWDFILRLTALHRTAYAPFLGVRYYNGEGGQRISNTEHLKDLDAIKAPLRAKHDHLDHSLRNAPENRPDWGEIRWFLHHKSIAIKIPAPYEKRMEWGDYHFAQSLQQALESLGHTVTLDFHGKWDARNPAEDEIVIVIRGLTPYKPKPEHFNIMWNISHPDQVPFEEYEAYDLICVASASFAAFLRTVIRKPIAALLQATDISRFYPFAADEQVPHDLLFVGNSRNTYRPIVRWAIESNTAPLAVYGTRWDAFIPSKWVKGANINNAELGRHYSGAKAVLNDHWDSMRIFGFISNRIFDILAAGGTVISDSCHAINHLFGKDVVRQVSNTQEARKAVLELGKSPKPEQDKLAAAQYVAEHHSFAARAQSLLHGAYRTLGGFHPAHADDARMIQPFKEGERPLHVTLICSRTAIDRPQSSGYIRLISPLTSDILTGKIHLDLRFEDTTELNPRTDICIVQRTAFWNESHLNAFLENIRKNGTKLIIDNDDTFKLMDQSHPEYAIYAERNGFLERLKTQADQIWVSTPALAESYTHINAPMEVVANTLDPRIWRDFKHPVPPVGQNKRVQMVYMGTATHDGDFGLILPALDELAERYPHKFELTLIGAVKDPPKRSWLRVQPVPGNAKVYPRFARWLKEQGPFDVGLAPLVASPFNSCKSDIKFLDYCALGILPVLSDVPAYQGDAKEKELALFADNTTQGWLETLEDACLNIRQHREKIARAQDYLWQTRNCEQAALQQYALLMKVMGG